MMTHHTKHLILTSMRPEHEEKMSEMHNDPAPCGTIWDASGSAPVSSGARGVALIEVAGSILERHND